MLWGEGTRYLNSCSISIEISCNWVQAHPPHRADGVCSALLIITSSMEFRVNSRDSQEAHKTHLSCHMEHVGNRENKVLICKVRKNTRCLEKEKCPRLHSREFVLQAESLFPFHGPQGWCPAGSRIFSSFPSQHKQLSNFIECLLCSRYYSKS